MYVCRLYIDDLMLVGCARVWGILAFSPLDANTIAHNMHSTHSMFVVHTGCCLYIIPTCAHIPTTDELIASFSFCLQQCSYSGRFLASIRRRNKNASSQIYTYNTLTKSIEFYMYMSTAKESRVKRGESERERIVAAAAAAAFFLGFVHSFLQLRGSYIQCNT